MSLDEAAALCRIKVQGGSYAEMELKARDYAARFFNAPMDSLILEDPPIARVVKHAQFGEDPLEPEIWEAEFVMGLLGTNSGQKAGDDAD